MAKKTAPPAKISKQDKRKYIIAGVSFVVIAVVIYLLFIFQGLPKRIKNPRMVIPLKNHVSQL